MKGNISAIKEKYINDTTQACYGNKRLIELFANIPEMTIDTYKKTAIIYATKKYDEVLTTNQTLPHGFYSILENSIKKNGLLSTLRIYKKDLELICKVMDMDFKDLKDILLNLKPNPKEDFEHEEKAQTSRAKLKEIIRRATSKFKEAYIKNIISEKTESLKATTIKITRSNTQKLLSSASFLNYILSTPALRKRIENIICDKLDIVIDENILSRIILATTRKNYKNELTEILGIKKPNVYNEFEKEKYISRLDRNFAPKLNKLFSDASKEEKELIIKILEYKVKCKQSNSTQDSEEFNRIKQFIKRVDMSLLEEISTVMYKANASISIKNNEFIFEVPNRLTQEQKEECLEYNKTLKKLRSIHNALYNLYKQQVYILNNFMTTTIPLSQTEEDTYEIDKDKWLDSEKTKTLIENINLSAINSLTPEAFKVLKKFLIEDGLLWAYLAGNIDINEITKIINNFSAIYSCVDLKKITIENISEIIKNANLYDYIDDISIALIGLDRLSKIINYNQFSGLAVTTEDIKKRIRKVIDLCIRSERTRTSSLPFNCDVKLADYSLMRYHNNDPEVFTCGVDTKTCFFVSVNENDFFFFSLLHKDGYVIRITDKNNNLIARASCFRKNNILMINGIRCLNNKVIPENQEDLESMKKIVDLIELMAKKMINLTTNSDCPIDYVVCNKAGILENDYFSQRFQPVNPVLFREPINIYSGYHWDTFVHLYDNEEEQFLQEVSIEPSKSFTTDFGEHYPALMITSRDYKDLVSPRDISLQDQEDTYERPRNYPVEYIKDEIDENILAQINRLRALACFTGSKEEQERKKSEFRLLKDSSNIKSIIIGDDWASITLPNNNIINIFANESRQSYLELDYFMKYIKGKKSSSKTNVPTDEIDDIKIYELNIPKK